MKHRGRGQEKEPRAEDMVLRTAGRGGRVEYPEGGCSSRYPGVKVKWASREKDADGLSLAVRFPQERTAVWHGGAFTAAGRKYENIRELCVRIDDTATWCRDIYGREVLYLAERFPCFDAYDTMYEHRFYRWFFLREGGRLTRVHVIDETDAVYVTEDVADLESGCWEEMKKLGYID